MTNITVGRREPSVVSPYAGASWDPVRVMRDMLRWDPFVEMSALPITQGATYMPDFDVKETLTPPSSDVPLEAA
ncbi:MAG: hypothetical protein IPK60_18110 [Sandaracinaceae bacterium]|nr:hypothetical protein [Sandaracinaceae bacterium]